MPVPANIVVVVVVEVVVVVVEGIAVVSGGELNKERFSCKKKRF